MATCDWEVDIWCTEEGIIYLPRTVQSNVLIYIQKPGKMNDDNMNSVQDGFY